MWVWTNAEEHQSVGHHARYDSEYYSGDCHDQHGVEHGLCKTPGGPGLLVVFNGGRRRQSERRQDDFVIVFEGVYDQIKQRHQHQQTGHYQYRMQECLIPYLASVFGSHCHQASLLTAENNKITRSEKARRITDMALA